MGIIVATISSLFTSFSNLFLKKSFKDFPPSVSFFIFSTFSVILWSFTGLATGVDWKNILPMFIVGLVSAVLGQLIYFYVLSKGELSITGTILSSYAIYTVIFSVIFNKESLSGLKLMFVAFALLGTIIVSFPEKLIKEDLRRINYILLAIFAAACIGISDTISKYWIEKTTIGTFLFCVSITQVLVSYIYLKYDKQNLNQFKEIFSRVKDYKFALLGSCLISIATLLLFTAFGLENASIVSPIAASYPVLTVALAVLFLKEKLTMKNCVGIVFVLVAIFGISI